MRVSSYYTYQYLRAKDGTFPAGSPYYVGKGQGKRAWVSHPGHRPPRDSSLIRIQYWPDEATAHAYEMYLIDFLGRIDLGTGCLRNLTNGGDGVSGYRWSEETRAKMRGERNPARRPEVSKKHSIVMKKRWDDPTFRQQMTGITNPNFGKGLFGVKNPNFGVGLMGSNNPMFGKPRPDLAEWNRKNLRGNPRGPLSQETKDKIRKIKCRWWAERKRAHG